MTSIEWTEQTWNPIIGCSIVSPGGSGVRIAITCWRWHERMGVVFGRWRQRSDGARLPHLVQATPHSVQKDSTTLVA